MKAYYYFLYRVYWHYRDSKKSVQGHKSALTSTSLVSSLVLFVILITIFGFLYFFQKNQAPSFSSNDNLKTVLIMLIIHVINYFLFIKPQNFLRKDFRKDKKGGFLVILFIIIVAFLFVIVANRNRDKIFKIYDKIKPPALTASTTLPMARWKLSKIYNLAK
jgi:Na+/proline symporter